MLERDPRDFSYRSYIRSDDWAKSRAIRHFRNINCQIIKSEEDYGVDLLIKTPSNNLRYVEVEVKSNQPFTCAEDYRFPTVNFLFRKKKWNHLDFIYMIICRETNHYVACNSKRIYKDEYYAVVNINTQDRGQGRDEFYQVPVEECWFYKLQL